MLLVTVVAVVAGVRVNRFYQTDFVMWVNGFALSIAESFTAASSHAVIKLHNLFVSIRIYNYSHELGERHG